LITDGGACALLVVLVERRDGNAPIAGIGETPLRCVDARRKAHLTGALRHGAPLHRQSREPVQAAHRFHGARSHLQRLERHDVALGTHAPRGDERIIADVCSHVVDDVPRADSVRECLHAVVIVRTEPIAVRADTGEPASAAGRSGEDRERCGARGETHRQTQELTDGRARREYLGEVHLYDLGVLVEE
jgi:hypothetical protein